MIMFTMYFTAGTIPDYLLMSELNMLDTIWCLILPLCFAPYNLLIMKNNFQGSIPESLIESARLDGASHFTILGRIVVPLSKPILATIALFYAVGRWNAYADALYYIKQRVDLRPLQLKLYYLIVAASESFQSEGISSTVMTNRMCSRPPASSLRRCPSSVCTPSCRSTLCRAPWSALSRSDPHPVLLS